MEMFVLINVNNIYKKVIALNNVLVIMLNQQKNQNYIVIHNVYTILKQLMNLNINIVLMTVKQQNNNNIWQSTIKETIVYQNVQKTCIYNKMLNNVSMNVMKDKLLLMVMNAIV